MENKEKGKIFVCLAENLAIGIVLSILYLIFITTLVVSVCYYTLGKSYSLNELFFFIKVKIKISSIDKHGYNIVATIRNYHFVVFSNIDHHHSNIFLFVAKEKPKKVKHEY